MDELPLAGARGYENHGEPTLAPSENVVVT
jgi:hypothetical protein